MYVTLYEETDTGYAHHFRAQIVSINGDFAKVRRGYGESEVDAICDNGDLFAPAIENKTRYDRSELMLAGIRISDANEMNPGELEMKIECYRSFCEEEGYAAGATGGVNNRPDNPFYSMGWHRGMDAYERL